MARNDRIGSRKGWIDRMTRLPWWVGLALATLSYLLLQHLAGAALFLPPPFEPARLARQFGDAPWPTLARIGQYLLSGGFLVLAAISALRRWRRSALLARVARRSDANALDALSWRQFELLVGEVFRRQGFRVTETGGGGADGGVDLVLHADGAPWLVQCKHWKSSAVGVAIVRELYGVIAASGATGGFVVTSGQFTAHAIEFAHGLSLTLIDGPRLRALAREASSASGTSVRACVAPAAGAPACPVCARAMVKRTARRGANAGREFWGCTAFPACRGTRPIE